MASGMQNEEEQHVHDSKRMTVPADSFMEKKLEDFVRPKSMTLLWIMELWAGFVAVDLDLREDREDYKQASERVDWLKEITLKLELHSSRT